MTDHRFRLLLLLYVIVTVAAAVVAFIPGSFSQELTEAYAHEPEPWISRNFWLLLGVVLPLAAGSIAGIIGLFLFKSWGRALSLYTTLLAFPLCCLFGPTLSSALETTLWEASTLVWGAILALAYYSPVASRFGANNFFKPNPLRGSA